MRIKHVIGYAATALVALGIGAAVGGGGGDGAAPVAAQPTRTVTTTAVSTVTKSAPGPTKFVTVTTTPQLAADIEEGTWEVGVDIKPGKYKVTEAVGGDCYWSITKTGRPDDIVANDIVTGGKPTVTLKKGQTFTTQDCGSWGRVK